MRGGVRHAGDGKLMCPQCDKHGGVRITDSRMVESLDGPTLPSEPGRIVRRRRRCRSCAFVWTTYEIPLAAIEELRQRARLPKRLVDAAHSLIEAAKDDPPQEHFKIDVEAYL